MTRHSHYFPKTDNVNLAKGRLVPVPQPDKSFGVRQDPLDLSDLFLRFVLHSGFHGIYLSGFDLTDGTLFMVKLRNQSAAETAHFFSSTFKRLFTDFTPLISLISATSRFSVSLLFTKP